MQAAVSLHVSYVSSYVSLETLRRMEKWNTEGSEVMRGKETEY